MIEDTEYWDEVSKTVKSRCLCALALLLQQHGTTSSGKGNGNGVGVSHEPFADDGPPPATLPERWAVRLTGKIAGFFAPLEDYRCREYGVATCNRGTIIIDSEGKAHGSGECNVSQSSERFCAATCGDSYVALLSRTGTVFLQGKARLATSAATSPDELKPVASGQMLIRASNSRFFVLSPTGVARSITSLDNCAAHTFPLRFCRYLALGEGDDTFYVDASNMMCKHHASSRAVSTPRTVIAAWRVPVCRLASGLGFIVATNFEGQVFTMGRNDCGQLGIGKLSSQIRFPCAHPELYKHFIVSVAAGEAHTLVATASGEVYGCGKSDNGQLGCRSDSISVFKKIPLHVGEEEGGPRCVAVAASGCVSLFVMQDGKVLLCGKDATCRPLDDAPRVVHQGGVASYIPHGMPLVAPDSTKGASQNKQQKDGKEKVLCCC